MRILIAVILTIGVLVIGCTEKDDQYTFVDDRYRFVYDSYGVNNPTLIDLDKEIVDLQLNDFELITSGNEEEVSIGNGNFMEVINDSVIVVVEGEVLKKVNVNSKEILAEVIYKGRGPGEYNSIQDISSTDSTLLMIDRSQFKAIEYNFNFEHIRDIQLNTARSLGHINTSYNDSKYFYPVGDMGNGDYLIRQLDENGSDITYEDFHKRLIPIGKQPFGYNATVISAADNKEVFIASKNMPLFFIYNEHLEMQDLYKLNLTDIDKTGSENDNENRGGVSGQNNGLTVVNPKPQILNGNARVSLNGFSVIDAIYISNKIFIYFSNRYIEDRYLIVLENKNENWVHSGSYRFVKEDGDLFTVFDLAYAEPWLYLSSKFEEGIIRVNTENL